MATPAAFPVQTKQAAGIINGVPTEVSSTSFSDKLFVTISQDGRLAHWVHVPLDSNADQRSMGSGHPARSADGSHLLPLLHLTATTVLGGADSKRDTLGQLYATQIASAVVLRSPKEKRLLVVGMGFRDANADRDCFLETVTLVLQGL